MVFSSQSEDGATPENHTLTEEGASPQDDALSQDEQIPDHELQPLQNERFGSLQITNQSSRIISDQEDGNTSDVSSGDSVYSKGFLFRRNRRVRSGAFFEDIRVKNSVPVREMKPRLYNRLGSFSEDETKLIFNFMFQNHFLNFMKGKSVAKLMSHLNVSVINR